MTTHTYRITGQILQGQSDHGLAHLRVEIWDFEPFLFDEIASTATDDDGRFEVEFTQPHYAEFLPFHRSPDRASSEAIPPKRWMSLLEVSVDKQAACNAADFREKGKENTHARPNHPATSPRQPD